MKKEKMSKKVYLQCGYEDKCKNKDCMNCPRKFLKGEIKLTQAEASAIEDFAVSDMEQMTTSEYHKKRLYLMQKIMFKVMQKVFKIERIERKQKK